MGNISYAVDILEGVATALAEVGEQVTVTRIVQTADPDNPTRIITTEQRTTVIGALMGPRGKFDPGTQTVRQVTEWYTDLLSVTDVQGDKPNTITNGIPSITWSTQEGDEVTLGDGTTFKLLANEQPRIAGIYVAAFHEVMA